MELAAIFNSALTYNEYRELVNQLIAIGKTTGNDQSEKLVEFTKLNIQRMNRLDKTIQLSDQEVNSLSKNTKSLQWLLIGDAWCGDCAQIIPVVNKIAEAVKDNIELRIVSRDTYPELIEAYLTNGAKPIPKLLVIAKETNEVVCSWGPRPKPAQEIMLNWKENKDTITWEDFERDLHLLYTKDKGLTIINEFITLIEECEKKIILQQ